MTPSRRGVRRARSAAGALAALLALALLISGCSGVPSSSAPAVIRTIDGGVDDVALPRGPLPGDDQRSIVAGFLRANVSTDSRHASARQYLTAEASATWQDSPVTIVEDLPSTPTLESSTTATVPIRRIGRVDTAGVYSATLGDATAPLETLSFGLVQVDGQWRIDELASGLYVRAEDFRLSYAQYNLYFWDSTETVLVPDPRYAAIRGQSLATFLLEQLLDSRRPALSQSLISRIPSDQPSTVRPAVVVTPGSPTDIELVGIRQQPADTIPKIAAQLAFTFGPAVSGALRIVENGSPVPVLGTDGTFRRADFAVYSPDPVTSPRVVYIRDGAVFQAPGGDPIAGNAGSGALGLTSVAATGDEALRLAAVGGPGGRTLYLGDQGGALAPVTLPAGTDGPLTRPSWAVRAGEVWVSDQRSLIRVASDGSAAVVPVVLQSGETADGRITALRLSRDGARVALIYGTGDERGLYIGSIVRSAQDVRVDPLIKITPASLRLTDVAWNDSSRLLVAGRVRGASEDGMWAVQIDGSLLSERSTQGLPVAELTSVTVASAQFPWVAVDNAVWEQRGESWARAIPDARGSAPAYVE